MATKKTNNSFAILGLGRFGMSIVKTLSEYDVDILACDIDETALHSAMEYAHYSCRYKGSNFDVVIMAMGEDFEASLIATMMAKEQGAKHVVVKAGSKRQKKILESVGADEVILPEHEMGAKIARRLVGSNILDILDESDFYTISEIKPMKEWLNKTIRQADIRRKHDLMVLAIRRGDKLSIPVSPDTVITEEDILITLSEHKKRAL